MSINSTGRISSANMASHNTTPSQIDRSASSPSASSSSSSTYPPQATPPRHRAAFPGCVVSDPRNTSPISNSQVIHDSPTSTCSSDSQPRSALPYLQDPNSTSPVAYMSTSAFPSTSRSPPPPSRKDLCPPLSKLGTQANHINRGNDAPRFGGKSRSLDDSGSRNGAQRKRPSPLNLGGTKAVGLDEELQVQRDLDGPLTAISLMSDDGSSLSNDMQGLSMLRQSVRQNLMARPVDSPLGDFGFGESSGGNTPDSIHRPPSTIDESDAIPISDVIQLVRSQTRPQSHSQILLLDTRPLGDFLDSHLPQSANISIPSLIFKRFSKQTGGKAATWDSLGSFISTPAGKTLWAGIDRDQAVIVVVLGLTAMDETARVLRGILASLLDDGTVKIVRGGWAAVLGNPDASAALISGENSKKPGQSGQSGQSGPLDPSDPSGSWASSASPSTLPAPRTAVPTFHPPPPIPPSNPPRVSHHPSMPSLRTDAPLSKRTLPTLSIHGNNPTNSSRRPPKLSLNLDKPLRSATLGAFPTEPPPLPTGVPGRLTVPDSDSRRLASPGLSIAALKSPLGSSFQTFCHQQSKLPPSLSSFSGVKGTVGDAEDVISGSARSNPGTPWSSGHTARPMNGAGAGGSGIYPTPSTTLGEQTATIVTARNALSPFLVSTILPGFLFLGPEITTMEDVETLKRFGVERILNVAIECNDDEGLRLRETFGKYLKVPMRDIVEESGVAKGMQDACNFLDDARLHSSPTYVHCRAGKSRSVTVVLAYLIHANAWTLKTSYAYVAERRRGISPNIGFVAELMQFEESELGLKQSGGVHGEGSGRKGAAGGGGGRGGGRHGSGEGGGGGAGGMASGGNGENDQRGDEDRHGKGNPRYMRESLPPAWSSSLDSRPRQIPLDGAPEMNSEGKESDEGRRPVGDERETRTKASVWRLMAHRAPVDRTTLQPGRRVSKAGLESLGPLASSIGDNNNNNNGNGDGRRPGAKPRSPRPDVIERGANTPSGERRLRWV